MYKQQRPAAANGAPGVDVEVLFAGPGEMRARCRELDWEATPLGAVAGWPAALRSAVQLSLDAGFAMCVYAGPELGLVYNDGFVRALGADKHPWALGRPAREVWPEVWERIAPELAHVMAGGAATNWVDQAFVIDRDGRREETYWTYGLSPVRGGDGRVVAVHTVATETTARVRAEAGLRASEQRLRRMVEVEGVGVLTFDAAAGTLLHANDAFLRMTGYTREQVASRALTWRTMTPPEHVAASVAEMAEFARSGRIGPYEKEYLLADGSRSWMLFAGAALGGGTVVEYCIDVSDRRRAEAALGQTRRRLEETLATARMAYWDWDPATDRTVASASAAEVFGLRPGEALTSATSGLALVHPEDRARHRARVEGARARGAGWHAEFRIVRPLDGQVAWLEERAAVTHDPASGAPHTTGLVWDITARKRAETAAEHAHAEAEAARERTARLQALTAALATASTPDEVAEAAVRHVTAAFGAVGTVIARTSADGQWLAILRALDMPDDVGAEWRRFPVGAPAPLADAARTGEPVYLESRAAWAARYPHLLGALDATGHEANAVVPLVFEGRVLGVLGAAFTAPRAFGAEDRALALAVAQQCAQGLERARLFEAERAARHEAERARAEAEAANAAKAEFLAVMSHELRTPLNAIGGYAELMEMGIRGPVTAQQREDLRRLQASQRHLLGLINEVLNYAKLETGTVHFDLSAVPTRDALAGAEALVAPQAQAKGLTLHVRECAPELVVRADAEKLRQILVNLLSNAVKFTDRGGRVTLGCAAAGERVHVSVRDTGIGIPADQRERIFDPFVQVRADLTRTAEGTGLGLAISRDLARRMGGDLTVESEPGLGSVFTLALPAG